MHARVDQLIKCCILYVVYVIDDDHDIFCDIIPCDSVHQTVHFALVGTTIHVCTCCACVRIGTMTCVTGVYLMRGTTREHYGKVPVDAHRTHTCVWYGPHVCVARLHRMLDIC